MDTFYSEAAADEVRSLEAARRASGATLKPGDVVAKSADPKSALHPYFYWDDDQKAAAQFRIIKARSIIQWVRVTYESSSGDETRTITVRQFHHNSRDGGYTDTAAMLASDELRRLLLDEARRDMKRFKDRYQQLRELHGVLQEIEAVLGVAV